RLISMEPFRLGPDFSKIEQANAAYELMIRDDAEMRDAVKRAHRNFLKELVYLLYSHDRMADAGRWFKYVRELYPDSIPPGQSLDEYALQRLTGNITELGQYKTADILEGLIRSYFLNLAADDDDRAMSYELFARKLWNIYHEKMKGQDTRVGIPP